MYVALPLRGGNTGRAAWCDTLQEVQKQVDKVWDGKEREPEEVKALRELKGKELAVEDSG